MRRAQSPEQIRLQLARHRKLMALLLDGYNLLHVTGISGPSGTLHSSREALLRFLASAIDVAERPRTTIVFDAADAPPAWPRTVVVDEMTVHYASNYNDADELIEELIAADHVPRSLTVVSSDHRIQRAARRRRARFVDSDIWFADCLRRRAASRPARPRTSKPAGPLSAAEVAYWLNEFAATPDANSPQDDEARRPIDSNRGQSDSLANPFPPGYGEDLLEEQ
jgi:predicted RNA-binding protein with PIN domain